MLPASCAATAAHAPNVQKASRFSESLVPTEISREPSSMPRGVFRRASGRMQGNATRHFRGAAYWLMNLETRSAALEIWSANQCWKRDRILSAAAARLRKCGRATVATWKCEIRCVSAWRVVPGRRFTLGARFPVGVRSLRCLKCRCIHFSVKHAIHQSVQSMEVIHRMMRRTI